MADLEKNKYEFECKTIEPGYYTIHRPSQCNLKFPPTQKPIHKKESSKRQKRIIEVSKDGTIRRMIVDKKVKIEYPVIWERLKYEELKLQISIENFVYNMNTDTYQLKQKIIEGEKKLFKSTLKPQPGFADDKKKEIMRFQTY